MLTNSDRPTIDSADQKAILELLCGFLSPLGKHRRAQSKQSKGKRSKRHRKEKIDGAEDTSASSVATVPELVHHITVGFNSTIKHLQDLVRLAPTASPASGAEDREENMDPKRNLRKLAVVFVSKYTLPALLTSSIPTLVAAASARHFSHPPIRLVILPREAEKRLAEVLFQPRVGFIGLLQDAPGGKALIDMAMRTSPVDVPWLKSYAELGYRPVRIKTSLSIVEQNESNQ